MRLNHNAGGNIGKQRWHWVYVLLAALDVLAVSLSQPMHRQLRHIQVQTLEQSRCWADFSQSISRLGLLAGEVNAPGNDAFASSDVPAERSRFNSARLRFARELAVAKQFPSSWHHGPHEFLDSRLVEIEQENAAMSDEAERLFLALAKHATAEAGKRVAAMARSHASLNRVLDSL